MAGETLGADPSVCGLADRIHARGGGSPFFAEEIVLTRLDSGAHAGTAGTHRLTYSIDSREIPARVQLIFAARIDRLGERERDPEMVRPCKEHVEEPARDTAIEPTASVEAATPRPDGPDLPPRWTMSR